MVASRFGDDIDYASRGPAVLRLISAGEHLELLHRFHGNAAAHAAGVLVIEIGAIHLQRICPGALPQDIEAGSHGYRVNPEGVALQARIQQREIQKTALVDGQPVDLGVVHMSVDRDCVRIHRAVLRRDRDFIPPGTRSQDETHGRFVSQQHRDNGSLGVETLRGHANRIRARRQRRKQGGFGGRLRGANPVLFRQLHSHQGFRHRRPGRVHHGDAQTSIDGRHLAEADGRKRNNKQDR